MNLRTVWVLLAGASCLAAAPPALEHKYNYVLGDNTCTSRGDLDNLNGKPADTFKVTMPCYQGSRDETYVAIDYKPELHPAGMWVGVQPTKILPAGKKELLKQFPGPEQVLLEGPRRQIEIYLDGRKVTTIRSPVNVDGMFFGLPVIPRKLLIGLDAINDRKKISIDLGTYVALDPHEDTRIKREAFITDGFLVGGGTLPKKAGQPTDHGHRQPFDQAHLSVGSTQGWNGEVESYADGACLSSPALGKLKQIEVTMSGVGSENEPLTLVSVYLDEPAYSFHIDISFATTKAMDHRVRACREFNLICTTTKGELLTHTRMYAAKYDKRNPEEGF